MRAMIWLINGILSGTATPGQSDSGSQGNKVITPYSADDWLTDFNGMSTHLGVFYGKESRWLFVHI